MATVEKKTGGPLNGVRVADFSIQAAGPWTGALLGMLGAEVIKIERPTGDGTRFALPRQRGMGTNYICLNVNKKNIVLDLKQEAARNTALRIVASCDVLVENFRGGAMDRLGLGYQKLSQLQPRLVYCGISGFGEKGPLAGAGCGDSVMQAFSGFARCTGAPGDQVEAFRFTGLLDLATASVATSAILAALVERDVSGAGQKIDLSMLEATMEFECTRLADLLHAGLKAQPGGSASFALAPDRAFKTLDREIFVTVRNEIEWTRFCQAVGEPVLAQRPEFSSNRARVEFRGHLDSVLEPIFAARPAIWWMRAFERADIAVSLAADFETFRFHQQIVANDMIANLQTPDWGRISIAGVPWHFSDTPCTVTTAAHPDEHHARILAELDGASGAPLAQTRVSGLKGLKVVEFAEGIAGPLAGLRLAELGADVVKLEPPAGDWLRHAAPLMNGGDCSASFYELNRGKRSAVLAGEVEAAGLQLRALLKGADVFICDRRPGELRALGIALDGVSAIASNDRLVTVLISDWGHRGPYANRVGSELTAQAMAGYTRYLGAFGKPAIRLGPDVASAAAATFAVQAVFAALYARNRSNHGQCVDVSLLNSALALKSVQLAAQTDPDQFDGPRVGGANHAPLRGWKTADNPVFIKFGGSIGTLGREGWVDFVKEVGLETLLEDPRCDRAGRLTTGHGLHAPALRATYEAAFARYPAKELCEIIARHGGDSAEYIAADEMLEHPQTRLMALVSGVKDGEGVVRRLRGYPGRFSRLKTVSSTELPRLGEHTQTVFGQTDSASGTDVPHRERKAVVR